MPQSYRSGLEVMSKNTEINLSFGRTDTARLGRIKQLERWNKSDVAKESGTELKHRKSRKIKFQDNVVFHSAVISGDTDEVERLLKDGYDVNCINDDGLTGLHHVSLFASTFLRSGITRVSSPTGVALIQLHVPAHIVDSLNGVVWLMYV